MAGTPILIVSWEVPEPVVMVLNEDPAYIHWTEQLLRLAPVIPHQAVWEVARWRGPIGTQTLHAVADWWKERHDADRSS